MDADRRFPLRMQCSVDSRVGLLGLAVLGASLALAPTRAQAFPQGLTDWQARYGAVSPSAENAECQLCHVNANGGSPWNAYGWDVLNALDDLACDLDLDGDVSNVEAFFCIESANSDLDSGGNDNLTETAVGTQPGWTVGASNTNYSRFGASAFNQLPPDDIGPVDPDGTEPLPPVLPPPPGGDPAPGPKRFIQFVRPGDSIQAAVDRARKGGLIFVFPGVYREIGDPTNAVNITRSVHLIGLSTPWKSGARGKGARRVVLENAGNQRNGIVVVPDDRTECMDCHSDMAPPFPVHPGVEPGLKMREPMIHDVHISGITIQGFRNNGLFTENVDGFRILDVESIGNANYGIFPTLSRNGLVARSRATGSDDSGIWVETSENVLVTRNLVEGNVNGFEVSNSDDIALTRNVARGNTVGMAILLLPDIFDDRPGAKRIRIEHNEIIENNKPNTARPGSVLAEVPAGLGILHLGVDDSLIARNRVEGNDSGGIALVDYCIAVGGTPFDCGLDPSVTPEFIADQSATGNRVEENLLVGNGTNPDPGHPFAFAAADLIYISSQADAGNCRADNVFDTLFNLFFPLPPCP